MNEWKYEYGFDTSNPYFPWLDHVWRRQNRVRYLLTNFDRKNISWISSAHPHLVKIFVCKTTKNYIWRERNMQTIRLLTTEIFLWCCVSVSWQLTHNSIFHSFISQCCMLCYHTFIFNSHCSLLISLSLSLWLNGFSICVEYCQAPRFHLLCVQYTLMMHTQALYHAEWFVTDSYSMWKQTAPKYLQKRILFKMMGPRKYTFIFSKRIEIYTITAIAWEWMCATEKKKFRPIHWCHNPKSRMQDKNKKEIYRHDSIHAEYSNVAIAVNINIKIITDKKGEELTWDAKGGIWMWWDSTKKP